MEEILSQFYSWLYRERLHPSLHADELHGRARCLLEAGHLQQARLLLRQALDRKSPVRVLTLLRKIAQRGPPEQWQATSRSKTRWIALVDHVLLREEVLHGESVEAVSFAPVNENDSSQLRTRSVSSLAVAPSSELVDQVALSEEESGQVSSALGTPSTEKDFSDPLPPIPDYTRSEIEFSLLLDSALPCDTVDSKSSPRNSSLARSDSLLRASDVQTARQQLQTAFNDAEQRRRRQAFDDDELQVAGERMAGIASFRLLPETRSALKSALVKRPHTVSLLLDLLFESSRALSVGAHEPIALECDGNVSTQLTPSGDPLLLWVEVLQEACSSSTNERSVVEAQIESSLIGLGHCAYQLSRAFSLSLDVSVVLARENVGEECEAKAPSAPAVAAAQQLEFAFRMLVLLIEVGSPVDSGSIHEPAYDSTESLVSCHDQAWIETFCPATAAGARFSHTDAIPRRDELDSLSLVSPIGSSCRRPSHFRPWNLVEGSENAGVLLRRRVYELLCSQPDVTALRIFCAIERDFEQCRAAGSVTGAPPPRTSPFPWTWASNNSPSLQHDLFSKLAAHSVILAASEISSTTTRGADKSAPLSTDPSNNNNVRVSNAPLSRASSPSMISRTLVHPLEAALSAALAAISQSDFATARSILDLIPDARPLVVLAAWQQEQARESGRHVGIDGISLESQFARQRKILSEFWAPEEPTCGPSSHPTVPSSSSPSPSSSAYLSSTSSAVSLRLNRECRRLRLRLAQVDWSTLELNLTKAASAVLFEQLASVSLSVALLPSLDGISASELFLLLERGAPGGGDEPEELAHAIAERVAVQCYFGLSPTLRLLAKSTSDVAHPLYSDEEKEEAILAARQHLSAQAQLSPEQRSAAVQLLLGYLFGEENVCPSASTTIEGSDVEGATNARAAPPRLFHDAAAAAAAAVESESPTDADQFVDINSVETSCRESKEDPFSHYAMAIVDSWSRFHPSAKKVAAAPGEAESDSRSTVLSIANQSSIHLVLRVCREIVNEQNPSNDFVDHLLNSLSLREKVADAWQLQSQQISRDSDKASVSSPSPAASLANHSLSPLYHMANFLDVFLEGNASSGLLATAGGIDYANVLLASPESLFVLCLRQEQRSMRAASSCPTAVDFLQLANELLSYFGQANVGQGTIDPRAFLKRASEYRQQLDLVATSADNESAKDDRWLDLLTALDTGFIAETPEALLTSINRAKRLLSGDDSRASSESTGLSSLSQLEQRQFRRLSECSLAFQMDTSRPFVSPRTMIASRNSSLWSETASEGDDNQGEGGERRGFVSTLAAESNSVRRTSKAQELVDADLTLSKAARMTQSIISNSESSGSGAAAQPQLLAALSLLASDQDDTNSATTYVALFIQYLIDLATAVDANSAMELGRAVEKRPRVHVSRLINESKWPEAVSLGDRFGVESHSTFLAMLSRSRRAQLLALKAGDLTWLASSSPDSSDPLSLLLFSPWQAAGSGARGLEIISDADQGDVYDDEVTTESASVIEIAADQTEPSSAIEWQLSENAIEWLAQSLSSATIALASAVHRAPIGCNGAEDVRRLFATLKAARHVADLERGNLSSHSMKTPASVRRWLDQRLVSVVLVAWSLHLALLSSDEPTSLLERACRKLYKFAAFTGESSPEGYDGSLSDDLGEAEEIVVSSLFAGSSDALSDIEERESRLLWSLHSALALADDERGPVVAMALSVKHLHRQFEQCSPARRCRFSHLLIAALTLSDGSLLRERNAPLTLLQSIASLFIQSVNDDEAIDFCHSVAPILCACGYADEDEFLLSIVRRLAPRDPLIAFELVTARLKRWPLPIVRELVHLCASHLAQALNSGDGERFGSSTSIDAWCNDIIKNAEVAGDFEEVADQIQRGDAGLEEHDDNSQTASVTVKEGLIDDNAHQESSEKTANTVDKHRHQQVHSQQKSPLVNALLECRRLASRLAVYAATLRLATSADFPRGHWTAVSEDAPVRIVALLIRRGAFDWAQRAASALSTSSSSATALRRQALAAAVVSAHRAERRLERVTTLLSSSSRSDAVAVASSLLLSGGISSSSIKSSRDSSGLEADTGDGRASLFINEPVFLPNPAPPTPANTRSPRAATGHARLVESGDSLRTVSPPPRPTSSASILSPTSPSASGTAIATADVDEFLTSSTTASVAAGLLFSSSSAPRRGPLSEGNSSDENMLHTYWLSADPDADLSVDDAAIAHLRGREFERLRGNDWDSGEKAAEGGSNLHDHDDVGDLDKEDDDDTDGHSLDEFDDLDEFNSNQAGTFADEDDLSDIFGQNSGDIYNSRVFSSELGIEATAGLAGSKVDARVQRLRLQTRADLDAELLLTKFLYLVLSDNTDTRTVADVEEMGVSAPNQSGKGSNDVRKVEKLIAVAEEVARSLDCSPSLLTVSALRRRAIGLRALRVLPVSTVRRLRHLAVSPRLLLESLIMSGSVQAVASALNSTDSFHLRLAMTPVICAYAARALIFNEERASRRRRVSRASMPLFASASASASDSSSSSPFSSFSSYSSATSSFSSFFGSSKELGAAGAIGGGGRARSTRLANSKIVVIDDYDEAAGEEYRERRRLWTLKGLSSEAGDAAIRRKHFFPRAPNPALASALLRLAPPESGATAGRLLLRVVQRLSDVLPSPGTMSGNADGEHLLELMRRTLLLAKEQFESGLGADGHSQREKSENDDTSISTRIDWMDGWPEEDDGLRETSTGRVGDRLAPVSLPPAFPDSSKRRLAGAKASIESATGRSAWAQLDEERIQWSPSVPPLPTTIFGRAGVSTCDAMLQRLELLRRLRALLVHAFASDTLTSASQSKSSVDLSSSASSLSAKQRKGSLVSAVPSPASASVANYGAILGSVASESDAGSGRRVPRAFSTTSSTSPERPVAATLLTLLRPLARVTLADLNSPSRVRIIRDTLARADQMKLSLAVAEQCSVATEPVWASWGLQLLRAGQYAAAREKFAHCMKSTKSIGTATNRQEEEVSLKPTVDEGKGKGEVDQAKLLARIEHVLTARPRPPGLGNLRDLHRSLTETVAREGEALAVQQMSMDAYLQAMHLGPARPANTSATSRSRPQTLEERITDPPRLTLAASRGASHRALDKSEEAGVGKEKMSSGVGAQSETSSGAADEQEQRSQPTLPGLSVLDFHSGDDDERLNECRFYLEHYGDSSALLRFFVARSMLLEVVDYVLKNSGSQHAVPSSVFVSTVALPCLARLRLSMLLDAFRLRDPTLKRSSEYLFAVCKFFSARRAWHILLQVQLFMGDTVRAGLTCVKLFLELLALASSSSAETPPVSSSSFSQLDLDDEQQVHIRQLELLSNAEEHFSAALAESQRLQVLAQQKRQQQKNQPPETSSESGGANPFSASLDLSSSAALADDGRIEVSPALPSSEIALYVRSVRLQAEVSRALFEARSSALLLVDAPPADGGEESTLKSQATLSDGRRALHARSLSLFGPARHKAVIAEALLALGNFDLAFPIMQDFRLPEADIYRRVVRRLAGLKMTGRVNDLLKDSRLTMAEDDWDGVAATAVEVFADANDRQTAAKFASKINGASQSVRANIKCGHLKAAYLRAVAADSVYLVHEVLSASVTDRGVTALCEKFLSAKNSNNSSEQQKKSNSKNPFY